MHSACVTKRLARRRRKKGAAQIGTTDESSAPGGGDSGRATPSQLAGSCRGQLRRRPAQTSLMAAAAVMEDGDGELEDGCRGGGGRKFHSVSAVASAIDRCRFDATTRP